MLTYAFSENGGPLYKQLCEAIREDVKSGDLNINEKLPSKRALAQNLGVSVITVENAYNQLIEEGYVYAEPKRGYFVADIADIKKFKTSPIPKEPQIKLEPDAPLYDFDLSSNGADADAFPFSVWAKIVRETLSYRKRDLLQVSPSAGVTELRDAIAEHLASFRGMAVDPENIVIGAGTEYLYGLLTKLLGEDKVYAIENPGYKKLSRIYENNRVEVRPIDLDDDGIDVGQLARSGADVAHVTPTRHFPTGIAMPVSRRYALLAWANEREGRYVVEDDYDGEFRLNGKPTPTLQSVDACDKVIYMNTFSKSLTSTIRISYMALPAKLARLFQEKLGFYSCTVSTFEQYVLAAFISRGYFEKHINRMRLRYKRKRVKVLDTIAKIFPQELAEVENDSGLKLILKLSTRLADAEIKTEMRRRRIKLEAVADFRMSGETKEQGRFIIDYANADESKLEAALRVLRDCCQR